ncbi:MAG: hypothetical protein IPH82_23075 [Chloroflexi bacterium]|nr:hypothetical protein [Chloroflexota bacterium]
MAHLDLNHLHFNQSPTEALRPNLWRLRWTKIIPAPSPASLAWIYGRSPASYSTATPFAAGQRLPPRINRYIV